MKYKKNQLSISLSLVGFLLCAIQAGAQSEHVPLVYAAVPAIKNLQLQIKFSKYRLVLIPSIVAFTICFNQKKALELIESSPIVFAILVYFSGSFTIDSMVKLRQIDQALEFFLFAQKMSRYLHCIFAIKNTMQKMATCKGDIFNEQHFSMLVHEGSGYSLEELEAYSIDLLSSGIYSINKLCVNINLKDVEEKTYLLCKEQISLEQILLLCKSDLIVHELLLKFYENPEQQFEAVMKKMCFLIRGHFNCFMKADL